MKILTIDTSSVTACCGVVDTQTDKVLSECFTDVPLTHSQTVLPMVEAALSHADMTFSEVEAIAVCSGPGSFTGVRIGVAAAKGLGFERDLPCASVSTLEALAHNVSGIPMDTVVCAVMDARCRQVYTATFSCDGGVITRLTADEAKSIDDLTEALSALGRPVLLVGDGALLCEAAMKDKLDVKAAPSPLRFVRARGTALAMDTDALVAASALQPTYLRLPQAERELKAKQGLK